MSKGLQCTREDSSQALGTVPDIYSFMYETIAHGIKDKDRRHYNTRIVKTQSCHLMDNSAISY